MLREQQLYAKASKCVFGQTEVEYLGHVINGKGVSVEGSKIANMQSSPRPKFMKSFRGFLGLTGYYRRFVKDYGRLGKALTDLLKKDAFVCSPKAKAVFNQLKTAMTTTLVLALPDYSKAFIVEYDASGKRVGAVLMQEGRSIAYYSKTLSPKNLGLSTNEKELLAVVVTVHKWKHYLLGHHFKVKTDHLSLKYLMEQKLTTFMQQKWLTKLLGFDYEIIYKQGVDNKVVDALSRVEHLQDQEAELEALSVVLSEWVQELKDRVAQDTELQKLIAELNTAPTNHPKYQIQHGLLYYKSKLVVGNCPALRRKFITNHHNSAMGG